MRHFFLSLLLLSYCLYADHEGEQELPLVNTKGAIASIVNGSVNVITGAYLDSEVDLVLPGITQYPFIRSYSSKYFNTPMKAKYFFDNPWTGWSHNFYSYFIHFSKHVPNIRVGYYDENCGYFLEGLGAQFYRRV